MKILYLITRAERGGAQVHVLDLIRGFRGRFEMEVAAGEDDDRYLFEEAGRLGVRCHTLRHLRQPMNAVRDARALLEISTLLRKTQPDLVHAHTSKAGVLGRLAARQLGIPSVFTAHTWCFAEGTSWKWKALGVPLERISAALSGNVITVSEANRQLALKHRITSPYRLVTVHNGIPDKPVTRRDSDSAAPVIIMVARFAPQKNQAMLLEAASRIRLPFRLMFVGAGPTLEETRARACDLGLKDRTIFTGNRADVSALLSEARIFALPTRWEGFPISILEAMRAGLPIVASDVGGVREAVADGDNGFLVGQNDLSGLCTALERLLGDPALRERMARRSRTIFEQNFTDRHMLEKTYGIYRHAIPEIQNAVQLNSIQATEPYGPRTD